jgi:hypothetical protein
MGTPAAQERPLRVDTARPFRCAPRVVPLSPPVTPLESPPRTESKKTRLLRVVIGVFVVFHALCAVDAVSNHKFSELLPSALAYPLRLYGTDLQLASNWVMFTKPPDKIALSRVEGREEGGEWFLLDDPYARGTLRVRIVDARLGRLHSRFGVKTNSRVARRVADPYLEYLCRTGTRDDRLVAEARIMGFVPERFDDEGRSLGPSESRVLYTHRCGETSPTRPRSGRGDRRANDEDDP